MVTKKNNLDEVEELWRKEPNDDYVLKSATEDKNEYPPKVQTIIKEEAIRRGLLKNRGEMPISPEKLCQDNETKHNEKSPSLMQKLPELIGSGLSFVLFFILYKYMDMGLSLAIPTIGVFICLWVANKFLSPAKKPMEIAIALQAGFVLSFFLIAILAGEFKDAAMWELFITTAAIAWLIIRPSICPVVLLTTLHVLTLLAIALAIFLHLELESLSPTYKGLLLNAIFRVPAIIFMYTGLQGINRQRRRSE